MRVFGKWLGRVLFGLAVLLAAFLAFAPGYVERGRNAVAPHDPWPVSAEAQALHQTLLVGDWHADSLLWKRDLLKRASRGQVDLPRLIEGNVGLQVFTAVTKSPAGQNYEANATDAFDNITALAIGQLWPVRTWGSLLERALYQAEKLHRFAEASGGQLRIIRTKGDLEAVLAARASGETVVGALLGIEGSHPLEGDLANLDALEAAGHRVIGLQHFFDNEIGGSLHGLANAGLTDFGREVVAEIERRGMVMDLAHSSPRVAAEALQLVSSPVIVSHTGIYSHCEVKRNFLDALMVEVARTGGVIGIGYWKDVTCDDSPAGVAGAIKVAIDVVGEDHVSLGSDFDGSVATAFDTSELPALTQALLDEGLTEAQIRKVMGENMVRVLRARLPE
ncbi:dipeptidase [Tropicimonas sediminicola]|uniref:Zn-dependent dipeptidase, dipeptidase homolog n=1 Tax=Tropicimonas sediminicola TaxID=1031541 RepID=A0A239ETD0_9RHOB|nr:dipeptidase [Tropicimonas sediminicola]SNS47293.1 Zn-dependent dipeptidase, dipeptidase homolog [Tropicimonas sediminicola]